MAINLNIVSKFDQKGLKRAQDALKRFASGAVKAAGAAVAGVGLIGVQSVRSFASFDAQMTKSLAIMGDVSDAMETEMANAAREVAKATTFSADQAAESFFFLASAGLDAEQAVAAMPQVAKFAQAGMFDMALATDLATDAQSALGLTSDDAAQNLDNLTRVTDVFVKANTLANTSVQQISEALTNKAGAALRVVNKDVEEGAAVLALFADQGVKGAEAGEKLNVVLRDVPRAAARNADGFRELGLEVLDADGNLRNMADIVDEFTDVLGPMSDAQAAATLEQLGLTRSVGDAIKLLLGGGDAIREYEEALRNAGGTTEEVSNNQLDTLSAKMELLRSRIADVGISIGTSLAPLADDLVEQLGPAIDGLEGPLIRLFEELAPKIAELIANIPVLIEAIIPLIDPVGNIVSAFSDLLVVVLPALKILLEELEPVIDSFTGFLAENGEVVGGLIVAFAIFRTLLAITSTALGVFAGASGLAAGASGGFFATLAKNPLGAIIALVVGGSTALVVFGKQAVKTQGDFSGAFLGILKAAALFQDGMIGMVNHVINAVEVLINDFLGLIKVLSAITEAAGGDPIPIPEVKFARLEPGGGGIRRLITQLEVEAGIIGGSGTDAGRQIELSGDELLAITGPLMDAARENQEQIRELGLTQSGTQIPFLPRQGPTQQNNITINAGLGVNGNRLAEDVVGLLEQYDRQAGPVFERAG